jgi:DNA-binding beta-propeller fold protein YncE
LGIEDRIHRRQQGERMERLGRRLGMKELKLCAAILAIVLAASCGSNSTTAGVTITPTLATVRENGTQAFAASVSGISTTTVYWQVCLPTNSVTVQPTTCTPIPGVTPQGATGLTGYGTITQQGLYTAPGTIPQTNSFVVMASSTVDPTAFAVSNVSIASNVQVQVEPTTVTMATGEHYQFTATVTGTTNTNVTWSVNGNAGGDATDGYICPNPAAPAGCTAGEYFAPSTFPGAITIKATSSEDSTVSGSASVTVSTFIPPTIASDGLSPAIVSEGSAQQDVYVSGTDLLTTTTLEVGGVSLPLTAIIPISGTLVRATIPGYLLQQPGSLSIYAEAQNGDLSPTAATLTVNPARPALVSVLPQTLSQGPSGATVSLLGGYYVPGRTTAQFNGISVGVTTSYVDSRHLNVTLPSGSLSLPGLYSLFVQNDDAAAAGVPSMSAKNVVVTPDPSSIPNAPVATLTQANGVGSGPSAVAIDYAAGIALIANSAENTVSVLNLADNSLNPNKIPVGNAPTGIAVDDLISPPLALVVNSADQTVSTINLSTMSLVGTALSVNLNLTPTPALPYSIGINPMTHRAIVTYQNTDEATILDLSAGTPVIVEQVGGSSGKYATGLSPAVAVDERLNWAVVSPGGIGLGVINLVDLGRNPVPGVDSGRIPKTVATVQNFTALGLGLNSETHQGLFTDPNAGTLTSFNVFNATFNSTVFKNNGVNINLPGYVAAAVAPLTNIGIAVNIDGTAAILNLDSGNLLQTVSGLGAETVQNPNPAKVAVDPATNEAVIANQSANTISVVSLGSARSNQIVESSPDTVFTSATPVTLTITGSGFQSGATVRLDQVPIATSSVISSCTTTLPIVCRQLTATVPVSLLGSARRFMLDVLNADGTVSNVTVFTVIQPVVVGTIPYGVAVDTDRDMAVVTNSADDTVNLVALSPQTPTSNGGTAGSVGVIGPPISVGGNPEGVAVIPRLGLAVVANSGSNTATIVDETQQASPKTVTLCPGCVPVGAAANSDTDAVGITVSETQGSITNGGFTMVGAATGTAGSFINVDPGTTGIAIDPTLDYAGVSASQNNTLDIVDIFTASPAGPRISSNVPAGVIFDPVNQVFVFANSTENTITLLNPISFVATPISAGINPTSVDYDYQTSTLVTVNSYSNTISAMNYDCPPTGASTACANPAVQEERGAWTPQISNAVPVGVNAIAFDARLDIAVSVDPDNNRILLIPLPH